MKSNGLKKITTFTTTLMLMFFVGTTLTVVTGLVVPDTAWAQTKKDIAKEQCAKDGGTWAEWGDGNYACDYGDTFISCIGKTCRTCWKSGGEFVCVRSPASVSVGRISVIRARASSTKKAPLTAIPAHFLPPRLRAIRINQIQKNKQRALMKKRGDVKDAHDRYSNKKQKVAMTKPTRPGVPMPTKPIRPSTPMEK